MSDNASCGPEDFIRAIRGLDAQSNKRELALLGHIQTLAVEWEKLWNTLHLARDLIEQIAQASSMEDEAQGALDRIDSVLHPLYPKRGEITQ